MNEFNKISLESRANHTHSESIEFDDDDDNINTDEKLEKSKCYDFFVARTLNKFVGIDAIFSYATASAHIRCVWAAVAGSRRIEWKVFANGEPRDQLISYLYGWCPHSSTALYQIAREKCQIRETSHTYCIIRYWLLWNTVVMWMIALLSDRYWILHSIEVVINR